jgi:DNA replication and repair protein RecF
VLFHKITLQNFRNIACLELSLGEGLNIIRGENAQGKTNLIEALWLFTGIRSFRGARESEMIRFGQQEAVISCLFESEGRTQSARIQLGAHRGVFLNEIRSPSASALCGKLHAIVFSPSHLALAQDGPAERRRFLDEAIGQLYPTYQKNLNAYQKTLQQRGALLRDMQQNPGLLELLDTWDVHLARIGAQIIRLRARYIQMLCGQAAEFYRGISGEREGLSVEYACAMQQFQPDMEIADIREAFYDELVKTREQDIRQCSTGAGPHRDEISLLVDGKSVRLYGSQGQKRSCVLALKLAECGIIESSTGSRPVILLDDVLSELDSGRRAYLLGCMRSHQVLITCCEEDPLIDRENAKTFIIENGRIAGEAISL